ncbi:endolytic transglycosylase MltG [Candidatus Saccharibacteria bacterium]|nr:endolytic transglycosylase MltG [Candidatus Saccharibacteria bacterium]
MNDIRPPKRPLNQSASSIEKKPRLPDVDMPDIPMVQLAATKKSRWLKYGGIAAISGILVILAAVLWYGQQLRPVDPGSNQLVTVKIPVGTSSAQLSGLLKQHRVIRSSIAFEWYVRTRGVGNKLQAGLYKISRGSSVASIVDIITSGKTETFIITFLPGATLAEHKKVLSQAGFSAAEIQAALLAHYSGKIFAGQPAKASLEGYVYGETYAFPADATASQVLERSFQELDRVVTKYNLQAAYKKQGLSLYEGITLASIIQREVSKNADQAKVAQVFLSRLKKGMQLGSDVTYQYAADMMGVARDPGLDSLYNTRIHTGLPPGPIASPGEWALLAVANPAKGDYLYFLSGDDDITYFARTNAEHEANIRNHCQKKCQIL